MLSTYLIILTIGHHRLKEVDMFFLSLNIVTDAVSGLLVNRLLNVSYILENV